MANFSVSEYGKYVSLQNVSGSGDPESAPGGGVYLFASGTAGSAKLYLQNEGVSSPLSLADGGTLQIAGDSGTDDVSLASDTFTFAGGDGLTSAVTDNQVSFAVNVDDTGIEINSDSLRLKDDGVTNAKLANIARGSVKVGGASNAPTDLDAKTSGQILVGDGTDVVSVAVSGDATLAANGALTLGADVVDGSNIADDSIDSEHYAAGSIDNEHLAADSVNGAKIADDSIDSEHIALGALDAEHYSSGSIENGHLAGSIANAKLSNSSVTVGSTEIALGASSTVLAGVTQLTASNIQVTNLDVVTINSINQTETTLEVSDKLIVSALSASSANSDGGGLKIGGGADSDGHASMLWDDSNSALDFNIGGTTEIRLADGVLRPETDDDVDLGASGAEFKDLYLDGVAYIDSLQADQLGAALDANDQAITNINVDSGAIDGAVIGANSAAAGTFTDLVAGGNVDLGDATSDTITATGRFDSDLVPSTDSARALGSSALQWSAAHVDVGHIDQLGSALNANDQAITNVNIDSGEIDNVDIGVNSAISQFTASYMQVNNVLAPDAAGGADLGTSALGFGDLYLADDKKLYFGNDQDVSMEYDEDGDDKFRVTVPAAGMVLQGTTPSLFIGDGGAEDTKIVFDGQAADFYMGLDDSADKLLIGLGATVGTTPNMTLESSTRNVGFHGAIQVAGNAIADSNANAAITLDGSGGFSTLGGFGGGSGVTFASSGGSQFATALSVNKSDGSMANDVTFWGDTAGAYFLFDASADKVVMHNGSNQVLELGTTAGGYAIEVANLAGDAGKIKASAFVTYSDETLKEEVTAMDNALDAVMSLNGVEFTWKGSGERDFGFLAQEVKSVLPQAVSVGNDGIHGVDYSRLTSVLVEAVKAQQVQIEELKNALLKK
jgi:hypothetical protein